MKHKDIQFPIPLSNGRVVTINDMPDGLSKEDIAKVCAVIKALAGKIVEGEVRK